MKFEKSEPHQTVSGTLGVLYLLPCSRLTIYKLQKK